MSPRLLRRREVELADREEALRAAPAAPHPLFTAPGRDAKDR